MVCRDARSGQNEKVQVGTTVDGSIVSRQVIGSYSGAYMGMLATSKGTKSKNIADFADFVYRTATQKKKKND